MFDVDAFFPQGQLWEFAWMTELIAHAQPDRTTRMCWPTSRATRYVRPTTGTPWRSAGSVALKGHVSSSNMARPLWRRRGPDQSAPVVPCAVKRCSIPDVSSNPPPLPEAAGAGATTGSAQPRALPHMPLNGVR